MSDASQNIRAHYGVAGITERILAALADAGVEVGRLAPEQLFPFDQLHGREIDATREHLAKLGLGPDRRLLDVGSGLGGPARYAAAMLGARVTGVDLTPEFVAAATELSALVGLADRVRFETADARRLPFEAASFDAASSLYVGMNLEDKPGVLAEIQRVLAPGARLVWSEAVLGTGEPPAFPLPWATDPSTSFLVPRAALEDMVRNAGFRVLEGADETRELIAFAEARRAAQAAPGAKRLSNAVLFGDGLVERRRNFEQGLREGKLASALLVAERA